MNSKQKRQLRQGVVMLALGCLGVLPATLSAAVLTWGAGGAGNAGTWTTSTTNWWNGSTNVAWSSTANTAEFRGTAGTVDIGTGITAAGLNFYATGYDLAGSNTLRLSAGMPVITVGSGVTATISAPISINGTTSYGSLSGGGTLVLNGALSGTTANASYFFLVNASNTLTLAGNNTYGKTLWVQGALNVNNAHALGNNAGVLFNTSTLNNTSGADIIVTTTNAYELRNGNLTFLGTYNLNLGNGNFQLTQSAAETLTVVSNTLTIGGVMSGSGTTTFIKAGAGTLVMGGSNTYSGSTMLNAGTIQLAGGHNRLLTSGTIVLNGGAATAGTLDLNGFNQTVAVLSGTSNTALGAVTNNGAGTSIFTVSSAANSSFAGLITDGSGGGIVALTKAGTGTLILAANSYTGATTLNGGVLQFAAMNNMGTGTAITFGGGTLQWGSGNTLDISGRTVTFASGVGTLDTNANNVIFANAIGNTGTGAMIKAGQGTLTLNAANTYSGATRITGGTLVLGNAAALQNSTLDLNASDTGVFSFGTLTTATFGGLNGTRNLTNTLALVVGNNNLNTTYSGVLSGTGSFTKTGTGTLTIKSAAANTFSGPLSVLAGVFEYSGSNSLGTSTSAIVLGRTTGADNVLFRYSSTLAASTYTGDTIARPFVIESGNTGTVTIDSNQASRHFNYTGSITLGSSGLGHNLILSSTLADYGFTTFSGVISEPAGTGSMLTVNGSPNAALCVTNNANSFTGGVLLKTGYLGLGSSGNPLGTGTFIINGGSGIRQNGYDGVTGNVNQIWNNDFSVLSGNGTVKVTFATGTAYLGLDSASTARTVNVGVNIGSLTVGAVVADGLNGTTKSLIKSGTSTLILNGANSYTGSTLVSAGQLQFGSVGAIPATSLITINSAGALNVTGAYTTLANWFGSGKVAT